MSERRTYHGRIPKSQLPDGKCSLLRDFLLLQKISQKKFAEKTGISATRISRMNTGEHAPTPEEQKKMVDGGMPEKDVKAFARAVTKQILAKKQNVPVSKKNGHGDASVSEKGVAVFLRIKAGYKSEIPSDLALIIMKECSL